MKKIRKIGTMKRYFLAAVIAAYTVCPIAAQAQSGAKEDAPEKEVRDSISKPFDGKDIPPKLNAIKDKPYSLKKLGSCAAIQQEIRELNAVLGLDVNERVTKNQKKKREETAGRVAGSAVGSIIPFGGLIGEVSGANAKRRRYNRAIYAGTVRRGFLKGIGLERGCKAPARP